MASRSEVVQHGRTAEMVFPDVGRKSVTAESSLTVSWPVMHNSMTLPCKYLAYAKLVHFQASLLTYVSWMGGCVHGWHGRGVRIHFVSVILKIALLCPVGGYALLASKA